MNEKLADLTEAELAEAALSNPRIALHIAAQDPRVKLMERLYGDGEAKKAIQQHSKRLFPNASVPEVDIPQIVRTELKEDLQAIKDLRATLETDSRTRRHEAFRGKLIAAGAEEDDLAAIETFMVDNEIGPKSLDVAVRQFYDAKELAEPRGTGLSPDVQMPADAKDEHMKALLATGPSDDLDRINTPWVEKIAADYPTLFPDLAGPAARRRRG